MSASHRLLPEHERGNPVDALCNALNPRREDGISFSEDVKALLNTIRFEMAQEDERTIEVVGCIHIAAHNIARARELASSPRPPKQKENH